MPRSKTEARKAVLSHFPEKLRPTLQLIETNASGEVALSLIQFVASFVHPDMVCNLAMMETLPAPTKRAAVQFFDHCMKVGMTMDERCEMLRFIEPYIGATLGAPKNK